MSNLNAGKRERDKIAAMLNGEWDSAEDLAEAVLATAFEMYEARAKFVVVGQLRYTNEGGYIDPEDARASKISLGLYPTETQAKNAAKALVYSTQTHEEFRSWCLPVHWGTPAAFYSERKKAREARALAARHVESNLEKLLTENMQDPPEPGMGWDAATKTWTKPMEGFYEKED